MATKPLESSQTLPVSEAIAFIHQALSQHADCNQLSNLQGLILEQSLRGKTYPFIAKHSPYDRRYVRQEAAHLWRSLSQVLGEPISNATLRVTMRRLMKSTLSGDSIPALAPHLSCVHDWGEVLDVVSVNARTQELATLQQWVQQDGCSVVEIVGMGGIGKTTLALQFAQQVRDGFDVVIWRSLRHAPSFQDTMTDLIQALSPQRQDKLPGSEAKQISRLLECLSQQRCLIVLDNLDSVLAKGNYAGQYREGYEGYRYFLQRVADVSHQSCLLLTSRERTHEWSTRRRSSCSARSLQLQGLSAIAVQTILSNDGFVTTEQDCEVLCDRYSGNPQAIRLAAATARILFRQKIAEFLKQGTVIYGDIWELLDQQFQSLSDLEQRVMTWLAGNQKWTSLVELREEMVPTISHDDLLKAIESLQARSLVEFSEQGVVQPRIVVEYMTERLVEQFYQGLQNQDMRVLRQNVLRSVGIDLSGDMRIPQALDPALAKLEERCIMNRPNATAPQFQLPCFF